MTSPDILIDFFYAFAAAPLPITNTPNLPATTTHTIPTTAPVPEEAAARFITTRPHINILKAHTSLIGDNPKPSFAAPTVPNPMQSSASMAAAAQNHLSIPSTIGIPIVPYTLVPPVAHHKNIPNMAPPPYPEGKAVKPTPNCEAEARNVHYDGRPRQNGLLETILTWSPVKMVSYRSSQPEVVLLPPPPPSLPRQPPPPPPSAQLATVYSSQLARSQIELYQRQLHSDGKLLKQIETSSIDRTKGSSYFSRLRHLSTTRSGSQSTRLFGFKARLDSRCNGSETAIGIAIVFGIPSSGSWQSSRNLGRMQRTRHLSKHTVPIDGLFDAFAIRFNTKSVRYLRSTAIRCSLQSIHQSMFVVRYTTATASIATAAYGNSDHVPAIQIR